MDTNKMEDLKQDIKLSTLRPGHFTEATHCKLSFLIIFHSCCKTLKLTFLDKCNFNCI